MTNKIIQLCGIGNALVDIQIEVPNEIIEKYDLRKEEMQLVDEDRQKTIISELNEYEMHKSSGGSAANSIIAFSNFGGKAAYQTILGEDEFGDFYAKEFTNLDIDLKAVRRGQYPTGTCLVLITPDSERTMLTSLGASAFLKPENINETTIRTSEWLYLEGYEFTQKDSTQAILDSINIAKFHDTRIALTFSDAFVVDAFKDNLSKAAENADLIFCNENEAQSFSGETDMEKIIAFFEENFTNFIVTKGAQGSIVKWNNNFYNIKPFPASARDTTGAGDMFAGAFLYGIIEYDSPVIAGHLASLASSKVVSQIGARLKDGYEDLKKITVERYA